MKVTFKALCGAVEVNDGTHEHSLNTLATIEDLQKLDGYDDPINYFSDYFDSEMVELRGLFEDTGVMSFHLKDGEFWVHTTYESPNNIISSAALAQLREYTRGQWSDGIGEGFEQFPVMEKYFISPYHPRQKIITEIV